MRETDSRGSTTHLIFGIRPILEALEANKDIDKIFVQKGLKGDLWQELSTALRARNMGVKTVPLEKLDRLTRKNHQGVVAFLSPITFDNLEDVVTSAFEKGEVPLVMILDHLTDVRNFGAIVRTAECAGVHAIVVPEQGAAAINGDAVKTSAGALMRVPICRSTHLRDAAYLCQQMGLQLVGCTEKTSEEIYTPDYTKPTAIIMGNEETGISNNLIKIADYLAKIPMLGEIGSLNVSVSAGVILYEAVRQRTR
jgi:23S rRNA (guanosine2251-2'-O)-methyltransferase